MPFHQSAIEWPAQLADLVRSVEVTPGHDGRPCCRIDVDVDASTLLLLNEFEARARHRHVRLRPTGDAECLVGEMNTVIGLGKPADPSRHTSRVRLSFHDIQGDDCVDDRER